MVQENCTDEAPRRGFAHAPTGFRRMTPGLLKADRSAEGFKGLPEGATSPGQLLAALKAATPRLGISPRLVHAVDWLFRFTQPQDWEKGGRPVVWPSASMQQEALGLSPTQVKEINRRLIELGLVTMKDSPNGKRYGKRDPKGRIVEAYGFDLSPIAGRHAEFRRLAEEGRAERAAMGRLRRRATIARKAIIQILETAHEYAIEGEEWQTLARESEALARALRACLAMGRELAAVALAIVSSKEAEHFRTSPGGYFHGMVAKANAGELHLERTVWALRRALTPERHAGRAGGSDRCDGPRAW